MTHFAVLLHCGNLFSQSPGGSRLKFGALPRISEADAIPVAAARGCKWCLCGENETSRFLLLPQVRVPPADAAAHRLEMFGST